MRTGKNIFKRKDGRWEARYIKGYSIAGKAQYGSIYRKTYTEAKDALENKLFQNKSDEPCKKDINISQLFDLWLPSVKIKVKYSTFIRYEFIANKHITPFLGGIKLSKLFTSTVENFIAQKLKSGKLIQTGGLDKKTVKDITGVLKSALKYAIKENYINSNILSFSEPKIKFKEISVLAKEEQSNLERYILNNLNYTSIGVLLCLYTGIRLGELCSLRRGDIDLTDGTIKIERTMQRIKNVDPNGNRKTMILIDTPKSSWSIRTIPLPSFLNDLLIENIAQFSSDCYILSGCRNKYLEPRNYQYKFKGYLKNCGLRDVKFHTLRHTFATRCIEIGFDIKSLSEILGHSNVNITLNRYVHSSFELKKSHVSKLSSVFCGQ